tara:strand:- start:13 stop:303 length:291 start_codon:yes stop_codon:yes gene_type:complete
MVDKKRLTRRKPRQLNVLIQGCESAERMEIIMSLVSFRSKQIIKYLNLHYVEGMSDDIVTMIIDAGNWARAVKKLNEVAHKIERIKEIDGCVKVLK